MISRPSRAREKASTKSTTAGSVSPPAISYIDDVAQLYAQGRYEEGIQIFLGAEGNEAAIARKVIAGYISYAFHRVGEVAETITPIDLIMGAGFNWAPPSVLVDTMGAASAVQLIEGAGLPVPKAISQAVTSGEPHRFFAHPQINVGKYFVAG